MYAYETTRILLESGEKLLGLFILDMRVPDSYPIIPDISMEFVEQTGLFTGVERTTKRKKEISEAEKMHFLMTVRALVKSKTLHMHADKRPDKDFHLVGDHGLGRYVFRSR